MNVKRFYGLLREINYFRSIEDQLRDVFRVIGYESFTASGIGIISSTIPDNIRLQLTRRFKKRGKLVFFDKAPLDLLKRYRDYVVFLVSDLYHAERSIEFEKYFEVVWAECRRNPKGLKSRFPAWKVIKGYLRLGRKEYVLRGVMRIPTYDERTVLFICHPEDTYRHMKSGEWDVYINLVDDIISKYRHGTKWGGKTIVSNLSATPLFFL